MTSPIPIRLRVDAQTAGSKSPGRIVNTALSGRPRFSWIVPLQRVGQRQTAFDVRLISESGMRHANQAPVIWETGPTESTDSFFHSSVDLPPLSAFSWSVRSRDETGEWSDWAQASPFETGPFSLQDWGARWVSHPALHTLRKPFEVPAPGMRARLHITAQGLVRVAVNGTAVNPDASDPTRSDVSRALYRTYDVTDLLGVGSNALDLSLGRGEWERTGFDPRVLAVVVVEHADGSRTIAGTDHGMLAAPSQVVHDEPFYLERHNLAQKSSQFAPAAALRMHEAVAAPASPAEPPESVLPDPSPPLHRVQQFTPREMMRLNGVRVYDVGANVAGRTTLRVLSSLTPGTVVRVVHGEHVDQDGRLDTTNLTMPYDHGRVRQALEYVLSGVPDERLEPWFSYHGFRYVEVAGLPDDAEIQLSAWSFHTDLPSASTLITNDPVVNRLIDAAKRTLLNNVHGIPEDCPTREQSGWTGDTASVTEFEFSAFDAEGFFSKWLADLRTSQQADGSIPAIAPDVRKNKAPSDPVWGAALQRVLIGHWLHYGDVRTVRETLPALRRWADFQLGLRSDDDDGVVDGAPISYGHDWLALEQTPPPVHHTAATIDCLTVLAELEHAVGNDGDAERRLAEADSLREAARRAFFDAEQRVFANNSQAAHAVAIEAGILTGAEAAWAVESLEADVRSRNNRVSSGFAATRTVVRALAHSGRSQVLYDALHQPLEPGIGAMLDHGPGTFWECWWIDPTNTGTGSLDHVGLGGPFAGWAFQHLAGVRPIGPGWSQFLVEPCLVDGVDAVQLNTETVRGTVRVHYTTTTDTVTLNLTVPVGAEAVLKLPGQEEILLGPGWHRHSAPIALRRRLPARDDAEQWSAPSRARVSPDVVGSPRLLDDALGRSSFRPGLGAPNLDILDEGLRCMPVPHAQVRGPVLRVRGTAPTPGNGRSSTTVLLDTVQIPAPAAFLYAMIDLCLENTTRPYELLIVAHGADGSTVEGTGRFWPAGWCRVVVDVEEFSARTTIEAVEVGLRTIDGNGTVGDAGTDLLPMAFHLGEVGYSTSRSTW